MTGWAQLPPRDLDAEEVVLSMALWGDIRRVQEAARRRWLCRELVALEAAVRAGEAPDGVAVARIWRQLARLDGAAAVCKGGQS